MKDIKIGDPVRFGRNTGEYRGQFDKLNIAMVLVGNRLYYVTFEKIEKAMKTRKSFKVNREAAIKIAMNTNGISREIAKKYTDSELKECLRLLKLKTNF